MQSTSISQSISRVVEKLVVILSDPIHESFLRAGVFKLRHRPTSTVRASLLQRVHHHHHDPSVINVSSLPKPIPNATGIRLFSSTILRATSSIASLITSLPSSSVSSRQSRSFASKPRSTLSPTKKTRRAGERRRERAHEKISADVKVRS